VRQRKHSWYRERLWRPWRLPAGKYVLQLATTLSRILQCDSRRPDRTILQWHGDSYCDSLGTRFIRRVLLLLLLRATAALRAAVARGSARLSTLLSRNPYVCTSNVPLTIRLLFFSLTQWFNEPIHFALDFEHWRTAEKVDFIGLYTRQTQRAVIFTDVTSELATVRRAGCQ